MWTVRYFRSKEYNWGGMSQQQTLMAKAKRGLLQFTPRSFDAFEWRVFSSPKRCLQVGRAGGRAALRGGRELPPGPSATLPGAAASLCCLAPCLGRGAAARLLTCGL